ncbi:MAG: hypothetical protein ACFFCP_05040 [Promethearchaeota archaeon]
MEQVTYDKSRVCQIPPTLIKGEKWYHKPGTSLTLMNGQTKAASLQLTVATLYLLIGVVSFFAIDATEEIFFADDGYFWYFGGGDTAFKTFFLVTIMPVLIGIIGLVFFYGLWIDNKKSWYGSMLYNGFGFWVTIFAGLLALGPVVEVYHDPSPSFGWYQLIHSYDNIWGILFCLVPLTLILSFASFLYLTAMESSTKSTSRQD